MVNVSRSNNLVSFVAMVRMKVRRDEIIVDIDCSSDVVDVVCVVVGCGGGGDDELNKGGGLVVTMVSGEHGNVEKSMSIIG